MQPLDAGSGLDQALRKINRLRTSADELNSLVLLEEIFEQMFSASKRLAVYGSLAPGEKNHHRIRGAGGIWLDGFVSGVLHDRGWAARLGYPAMSWDPEARRLPVKLLVSDNLPRYWESLDRFEGPGYRRILVPVHRDSGLIAVANLYEGVA